MRTDPCMYIGEYSMTKFGMYLQGYLHACMDLDKDFIRPKEFALFRNRLAKKYHNLKSIWIDGLVLEKAEGDEEQAFHLFWQEWDEFCKENLNE